MIDVEFSSSWNISKKNSLGSDFESLAIIEKKSENDESDSNLSSPGSFLDVVDMDHYLFFERPEKDPGNERCVFTITSIAGASFSKISLVTDARNIEIFTGESGQVSSYWKTVRGRTIDELSELGSETYLHEICFDCLAKFVELKLGKSSDSNLYLFGLKIQLNQDSKAKNLLFQQNSIDFGNVESILKNSHVPLSDGAERALTFLKHSEGLQKKQVSAPSLDTIMNLLNQSKSAIPEICDKRSETDASCSSDTHEMSPNIASMKSYFDIRLKEMEESLIREFDIKLKAMEDRQNEKFQEMIG
uniref:CSON015390 protein n=1 Tax=Culicoides sonorensis TaxID=179676 RepID=A0A336MH29_CULSO